MTRNNPFITIPAIYLVLYLGVMTIFWFIFKVAFFGGLAMTLIAMLGYIFTVSSDLFDKFNGLIEKFSKVALILSIVAFLGFIVMMFAANA